MKRILYRLSGVGFIVAGILTTIDGLNGHYHSAPLHLISSGPLIVSGVATLIIPYKSQS